MRSSRLGDYIEPVEGRNTDLHYGIDNVRGISIKKCFIPTKADMDGVALNRYLIISPGDFCYVTVTSRNGEKITIAYNDSQSTFICSSSYVGFRIQENKLNELMPDFLFICFNRPEFDRYTRFNSWGSARETFSWDSMCEMEINLPPLSIQQKYVDVYKALVANQMAYESGLDELKLVCDASIQRIKEESTVQKLGSLIRKENLRNIDNKIHKVMGLSTEKRFREANSRVDRSELSKYKVVSPLEFAFVEITDTWKCFAHAMNDLGTRIVVSPIYQVFSVDKTRLNPQYLSAILKRNGFDRFVRYHSWGSAREVFSYSELAEISIPTPNLEVQKAIAAVFEAYEKRKKINDKLKKQISEMCPILIKGSNEEAQRG
ncbi:MAG: restriction endonuclease subunit S [Candidatus Izemoplasmatales bacterium]